MYTISQSNRLVLVLLQRAKTPEQRIFKPVIVQQWLLGNDNNNVFCKKRSAGHFYDRRNKAEFYSDSGNIFATTGSVGYIW